MTPAILANGAIVLAYTERHPGGNGLRRHGIALCEWVGSGRVEHVTWIVAFHDDTDSWHAEAGHYFDDIADARNDYNIRAGTK